MPAIAYNQIIEESKTDLVLFLHADVLFGEKFLNAVEKTIDEVKDFGALGVVGVVKPFMRRKKYVNANENTINQVTTLDSCCVLINKKNGLRFDENNFNEFHLFVEDYCMQVKYKTNLKIYLIRTNFYCSHANSAKNLVPENNNNYFYHGSDTFKKEGSRWGQWMKYKKILDRKWNHKVITN